MLGLPKYLLPFDNNSTLVEKHISGALEAGFDNVIVASNSKFFAHTGNFLLSQNSEKVTVLEIEQQTRTMNETIQIAFGNLNRKLQGSRITVGLADSAILKIPYREVYLDILNCPYEFSLSLFEIRSDQIGKLGQVKFNKENFVIDIKDKDPSCVYSHSWGLATFPFECVHEFSIQDAHIGISLAKLTTLETPIYGIRTNATYFDCGTLDEYRLFLNSQ